MYTTKMGKLCKSGPFFFLSVFFFKSWFPNTPLTLGPFPSKLVSHVSMLTSTCAMLNFPLIPGYSRPSHGPVLLQILFPRIRMPFPVFLAAKFLLILLMFKKSLAKHSRTPLKMIPPSKSPHHFENGNNNKSFFNLFILKTDERDQGPVFNNFLNKSVKRIIQIKQEWNGI